MPPWGPALIHWHCLLKQRLRTECQLLLPAVTDLGQPAQEHSRVRCLYQGSTGGVDPVSSAH